MNDSTIIIIPCSNPRVTRTLNRRRREIQILLILQEPVGSIMQKNKPTRKKSLPSPANSELKLPKIPKISVPKDFKIRTQPLFSLAEEVLKLPPPPSKAKIQAAKAAEGGGPTRRSSGEFTA